MKFSSKYIINSAKLLLAAALPLMAVSCDDDPKPDWTDTPDVDFDKTEVSVVDGAVLPVETPNIIVTYSVPVVLNPTAPITLNGNSLNAEVDVNSGRTAVKIPVTLSAGKEYTLEVPGRAVVGIGTKTFAPGFTLKFSTEGIATDYAPLTNPNATASAVNVYNFLLENNGKKIVSGVSAGDGNNDKFADWVSTVIGGKHAGLACYDFLHHKRSGESWIDYTDISAAKAQWDANGLVSYMWHWNVPTDENAYKNKDWDKYGFYNDKTNFDIKQALTPGTWENKVILEDIDQVAGYLKQLQDAGVAVIWRPLHEAAGSFKYNNPWFWWGRGGVEATKELWKLMRERLEGTHGLNNLIWVWTSQFDEGYEAEMANAYPGNDLVDIVGVDLYRDFDGNESPEAYQARVNAAYGALNAMVNGKKMVALSECGYLNDLSANIDAAPWAWFMLWNSDISNNPVEDGFHNTTEWIKTVFTGSAIINREEMPSLK